MNNRTRNRQPSQCNRYRRGFEHLEDRRVMAVLLGSSTFDAGVMGDNFEFLSNGAAVGYGYAINAGGTVNAATGGDGLARTAANMPITNFNSLTEMEVSSVSKTITATAILHKLQSMPGGLDAQLNTRLVDYLPSDWNPGSNVQNVSLRHLLTHSSGFLEVGNSIGVDFNSYGNNNFANLEALVEAGLPAPTIAADSVYDTPRWNPSYNNANFSLLAKVVLPKLINPASNLTANTLFGPDLISGIIYKNYVKDNIFDPMGITGADMKTNLANPAVGYNLATANANAGLNQSDLTNTGGAFGWKLKARELATFLDAIEHDNSILWSSTRNMRDQQELGWFASSDNFGTTYSHNGATGGSAGNFRSQIASFPGDIQASYLMNSESTNLPGGSTGQMMKTAYLNGWTDLTVGGTSGDDNFVLRLDNTGLKPSVEVVLNGNVEFTHWVSTLDSVTINGGFGSDTFTIEGWNSAIDLDINGGWGNDSVSVLPGVKNIEMVSGLTFNGGFNTDTITINDQSNPYSNVSLSRMYTISDSGVSRFRAHPFQPANPGLFLPVSIAYSGVESADIRTGGQADIVNVASALSGVMNVRTMAGNDLITVGASLGNLEEFDNTYIDGGTGGDTVRIFDHNESGSELSTAHYDIDDHSVSRYTTTFGFVTPGGPTTYDVNFSNAENLELTTTDFVDSIRVHATTEGLTTINGGAGNDRLYASPDDQNMELVDDLTFNGDAGIDKLFISDQNNPYGFGLSDDYDVSASRVIRGKADIYLIGTPANINVDYSSVEDLTLSTGSQGDTVDVESTPWTRALIKTGDGDDVVNASPMDRNMELVDGLEVDGGSGADTFNVFDQNNPYELPGGGKYTITPEEIGRYEEHVLFDNVAIPIDVQYGDIETVTLASGNQGDEFTVDGTAGVGTLSLDGNGGADEFYVVGPAFEQINIAGDFPIFAPGDQLHVNEDALYETTVVPGLYVVGSGAVTIESSTVSYSGIETMDLQEQLYGKPGDFDEDGDVDGVDLTHASKGWHERFGDEVAENALDGFNFLTWQQNYGNTLPRTELTRTVSLVVADEPLGGDLSPLGLASNAQSGESEEESEEVVWGWPVAEDNAVVTRKAAAVDASFAVREDAEATSLVGKQEATGGNWQEASDEAFADWALEGVV
ncbi:serine hydrolase domain-containing protein [Adhaeretor mobilis]|nr:serine hydrolase domain-containing protein [Adhaeretor mobilis]